MCVCEEARHLLTTMFRVVLEPWEGEVDSLLDSKVSRLEELLGLDLQCGEELLLYSVLGWLNSFIE